MNLFFFFTENRKTWEFVSINNSLEIITDEYNPDNLNAAANRFQCHKCNKHYKHYRHLQYHSSHECGFEPRYQCEYCPYRSNRKSNLKAHKFTKHLKSNISMLI